MTAFTPLSRDIEGFTAGTGPFAYHGQKHRLEL